MFSLTVGLYFLLVVDLSFQCHRANSKDVEEARDDVSKVVFVADDGDEFSTTTNGETTTSVTTTTNTLNPSNIQCIDGIGNFECVSIDTGCSPGYSPNPAVPGSGIDEIVCLNLEVMFPIFSICFQTDISLFSLQLL